MAQWLQQINPGDWYQTATTTFEIVGVDADAEVVLVQHFDGALEEVEFDAWIELDAVPCAPPEDYSGALDLDAEDLAVDAAPSPSVDDTLKRLELDPG